MDITGRMLFVISRLYTVLFMILFGVIYNASASQGSKLIELKTKSLIAYASGEESKYRIQKKVQDIDTPTVQQEQYHNKPYQSNDLVGKPLSADKKQDIQKDISTTDRHDESNVPRNISNNTEAVAIPNTTSVATTSNLPNPVDASIPNTPSSLNNTNSSIPTTTDSASMTIHNNTTSTAITNTPTTENPSIGNTSIIPNLNNDNNQIQNQQPDLTKPQTQNNTELPVSSMHKSTGSNHESSERLLTASLPESTNIDKNAKIVSFIGTQNVKLSHSATSMNNAIKKSQVRKSKKYYCEYITKKSISVGDIAKTLGLKPESFSKAVGIQVDSIILSGTKLYVPIMGYTILPGDTLLGIAKSFDIKLSQILNVNPDLKQNLIIQGTSIALPVMDPAGGKVVIVSEHTTAPPKAVPKPKPVVKPSIPVKAASNPVKTINSEVDQIKKDTNLKDNTVNIKNQEQTTSPNQVGIVKTDTLAPDKTNTTRFTWPVTHVLGFTYNSSGKEGILVSTNANSDVIATDDGIIAYVGGKIPTYGELVVIRHDQTYLSIYGYVDAKVHKGDKVKRGQVIAKVVGKPDDTAKTKNIMFSIRADRRVVDAIQLLPKHENRS